MVTCQSSELGWEVTVELPADFLLLGRGSVIISSLIMTFFNGVDMGELRRKRRKYLRTE